MEEIIIKQRQIKEDLVEIINNSSLPAFILKPIFKELYEQIIQIEENQYNEAVEIINKKNAEKEKEEK